MGLVSLLIINKSISIEMDPNNLWGFDCCLDDVVLAIFLHKRLVFPFLLMNDFRFHKLIFTILSIRICLFF